MAITLYGSKQNIIQVQQTILTSATSVSTTGFTEITGLATTITPSSASNKILVFMSVSGGTTNGYRSGLKLVRNSTDIFVGDASGSRVRTTVFQKNTDSSNQASYDMCFYGMDSPATTSAVTYKVYAAVETTGVFYINRTADDADSVSHFRPASSLILMEVAYS